MRRNEMKTKQISSLWMYKTKKLSGDRNNDDRILARPQIQYNDAVPYKQKLKKVMKILVRYTLIVFASYSAFTPSNAFAVSTATSMTPPMIAAAQASEYAKARAIRNLIGMIFFYGIAVPYFYEISGFRRSLR